MSAGGDTDNSAVLDSTADGIVVIDAQNRILLFNRAAERLFGYSRSEVLGRDVGILLPPLHRDKHADYVRDYVLGGPCTILGAEREVSAQRKDGAIIPIALRCTEIEGSGRRQFVAIVQDVAARKQAEATARRAETMEAVARLASGLVHDVNNFVFAIRGFAESALGSLPPGGTEREDLDQILRACDRVFALARELKLVGGGGLPCLSDFSPGDLLGDSEPLLRQVAGDGVRLEMEVEPGAGEIHGDWRQVQQAVINLVANARDACERGGRIVVRCGAVEIGAAAALRHLPATPGPHVEIAVVDDGDGIAPETLPRIFEPFFTAKGLGPDGGLGLSTVYTVVQRHRGGIHVESAPGKGTTFRMYFPRS